MTTETLERSFAITRGLLANVKTDQLDDPTPCQSWTVRDLINHFVGASHWFAASVNAGTAPHPMEDDVTKGDFVATYDQGIKDSVAAFGAPGAMEKMITLPFGTLPGALFIQLAQTDAFMHGWDLARSTGQPSDLDHELAEQLLAAARVNIQPAFRGPDGQAPFGAEQEAPPNATPADRLAAFLGRTC